MNVIRLAAIFALALAATPAFAESPPEAAAPQPNATPTIEVQVDVGGPTPAPAYLPAVPPAYVPTYAPAYAPAPVAASYPAYYAPRLPQPVREPYHGGPIPEGAYLHSHRNNALLASGAAILGASYVMSLMGALWCGIDTDCSDQQWLFVPLLGPAIAMTSSRLGEGSRMWLGLDEAMQLGGLALLIASELATHRELVYPNGRQARATWSVAPYAQRNGAGVSLSLTTF